MKKIFIGIALVVVSMVTLTLIMAIFKLDFSNDTPVAPVIETVKDIPQPAVLGDASIEQKQDDESSIFGSVPMYNAKDRVNKKPFGIYITPENSPISPERFEGYHTGTDYETFLEEQASDVSVRAVCPGVIIAKRYASGYGGVVVELCEIDGEQVTVVYGHIALRSVIANVGDDIAKGNAIGMLGAGESTDADGERKHLHLSIHKGSSIDIRGYVENQQELSEWIDPCTLFCK